MKRRHLLTSAISSLVVALPAYAGVQTMTSDEMVETYVKDSAVIVVPKERKKSDADRQRILRSLTISPGEPVLTEAEEEAYRDALQRYVDEGKTDATDLLALEARLSALLVAGEDVLGSSEVNRVRRSSLKSSEKIALVLGDVFAPANGTTGAVAHTHTRRVKIGQDV